MARIHIYIYIDLSLSRFEGPEWVLFTMALSTHVGLRVQFQVPCNNIPVDG